MNFAEIEKTINNLTRILSKQKFLTVNNLRYALDSVPANVVGVLLAIAAVRPPSALVSDSIGWGGDDHRMFTVKSAYSLRVESTEFFYQHGGLLPLVLTFGISGVSVTIAYSHRDFITSEDIYHRSLRMIVEFGRASSMLRLNQQSAPLLTSNVTIMSSNSRKVGSSILSSIFELLSRPWEVHVAFVRREGNVVADAISRLVLPDSLE
ncbi:hypothetical protein V6N11_035055 [Hibiscus sabdariffa]|uniref:RNase H type-1 domain-containing protein n=1 Tax=Hibiscus sabdariffa TaxID=183260 RepID=A0ABR2QZ90_9ROSI